MNGLTTSWSPEVRASTARPLTISGLGGAGAQGDGQRRVTAVSLFAAAVFINAFLLFLLQPMFGKMALPHLGGSAAVWTTCLLFFETALVAGYLYAHVLASQFRTRTQVWIHATLLVGALVALPVGIPADWAPADPSRPVTALLGLLSVRVGAPFVLLAAGSPLLQHWFATTSNLQRRNPYTLYAASNIGSAVGLLFYPLVFEPHAVLKAQSEVWLVGYALLAVLATWCGLLASNNPVHHTSDADSSTVTWHDRVFWTALAAAPSSLLLGVTTHITTDLAPIPLLWIIPLALYLLTFAIAFGTERRWLRALVGRVFPFPVIAVVALILLQSELRGHFGYALHLLTFFICALACHLRLSARRPGPSRLTDFYIWIAIGGALGGVFNVIIAPAVFRDVLEYPIAIVAAASLYRPSGSGRASLDLILPIILAAALYPVVTWISRANVPSTAMLTPLVTLIAVVAFAFRDRPARFALALGAILVAGNPLLHSDGHQRLAARSFYGVYRVVDEHTAGMRRFYSGTTIHGSEFLGDSGGRFPLAYYHPDGPLGSLFAARLWRPDPWRVGVIGLGVGATAAYARPGESWTFYEIDPLVADVAANTQYFHFLSGARVPPRIVLGDARLSLEHAAFHGFDVLLVDAFSSDAIPIHLLTREALALYRSRLAPDGIIAWHISNQYLDLRPVLASLADNAGLTALIYADLNIPKDSGGRLPSVWVAMTASAVTADDISRDRRWRPLDRIRVRRVWTDDFSNVLSVLR